MSEPRPPVLEDILAPNLKAIFIGLNPSAGAAATGHHFESRSNRFWPVLHQAGFTPALIQAVDGRSLLKHGYGVTSAVPRATVSAAEVAHAEYIESASVLAARLKKLKPRYAAFLGKAAYAAIAGQRDLAWGEQPEKFGGVGVWLLPNPSGLNRNFTLQALVEAYRELRMALG